MVHSSLEELKEVKGQNPELRKINGKFEDFSLEYISVRITEYSTSIYVHNSERLLKIAYEIERLMISRKRKKIYSWLNSRIAKINIILNLILLFSSYIYFEFLIKKPHNFSFWFYLILFWSIIFIISVLNPQSNTKIELERKHQLDFFKKNRERILLILITAIITTIVGIILGFFGNIHNR